MTVVATQVVLKTPLQIERMRAAGCLATQVLFELGRRLRPGLKTADLDAVAGRLIADAGAVSVLRGASHRQALAPFPACICVSVNDEVVHGIPGDRVLAAGDLVKIDCGLRLAGYCADVARSFAVEPVGSVARQLIAAAEDALAAGLRAMRPWGRWHDVAASMESVVAQRGFSVVREYHGHGIGRELHEPPRAPGFTGDRAPADFELTPGLTLAVEPLVTAGDGAVRFADERRWTVATQDGSWAAHVEDTVAVTEDGIEILTRGREAAA